MAHHDIYCNWNLFDLVPPCFFLGLCCLWNCKMLLQCFTESRLRMGSQMPTARQVMVALIPNILSVFICLSSFVCVKMRTCACVYLCFCVHSCEFVHVLCADRYACITALGAWEWSLVRELCARLDIPSPDNYFPPKYVSLHFTHICKNPLIFFLCWRQG